MSLRDVMLADTPRALYVLGKRAAALAIDDESGNGLGMTWQNLPQRQDPVRDPVQSTHLDGVDDWALGPSLAVFSGTNATWEVWIRRDSTADAVGTIFCETSSLAATSAVRLRLSGASATLNAVDSTNVSDACQLPASLRRITMGNWHQIVVVKQGSAIYMGLDGILPMTNFVGDVGGTFVTNQSAIGAYKTSAAASELYKGGAAIIGAYQYAFTPAIALEHWLVGRDSLGAMTSTRRRRTR